MAAINVHNLTKHYKVHQKDPGLIGSVKSLFVRDYKTVNAVDNVSFDIEQGELVGFIGPNGAGKTTTLKCLSGLLYPTSGEVKVLDYIPSERKSEYKKQFSIVMGQKNQLWWDLPPIETYLLNKEIYQIPDKQFKHTLKTLVDLLEVDEVLHVQVRKLSLGQRMKCELIAALLHNPKVLFLDEPTIGLDVVMQKVVRDFIKKYNKEFRATILLTSHYMDDLKELCDRIIIIDHGQLLFDGPFRQVIDKYASNKILTITFSQEVNRSQLSKLGEIESYNPLQTKLLVSRKNATLVAARLFQEFQVSDLNIEEVPIEDVIRTVFQER